MTKEHYDKGYQYGVAGFEKGIKYPALDADFMKEKKGLPIGPISLALSRGYSDGYSYMRNKKADEELMVIMPEFFETMPGRC